MSGGHPLLLAHNRDDTIHDYACSHLRIAKKLGIQSQQVLAKAKELGITDARSPLSSLDKITVRYLEERLRDELDAAFRGELRGLDLGNFKAFADTQHVPIRPVTLIFSANSSGKSSVIHGLLLTRHAMDTGELDASRSFLGGTGCSAQIIGQG